MAPLKAQKVKLFFCLVVAGLINYLSGGYPSGADNSKEMIDWDRVRSAFDAFLEYPSPENAKAFSDTIPKDATKNERGDKSKILDHIFNIYTYGILENEIWAGNRYAIEAAFRLLNFTDGSAAQDLCATFGALVRINPRLFFEVLYEYKDSWFIRNVRYPLNNFRIAYADRMKAQIYEMEMRIKAIESIEDEKYREIRNACIRQLRKTIKESS